MNGFDDDDFGGPPIVTDVAFASPVALAPVIPFGRMKPDPGVIAAWDREIAAANSKLQRSYRFRSPIDAAVDMDRKRKLPTLPLPPQWNDFNRRAVLYVGELMAIAGPSGGGKTSFAIEICRAAAGMGMPVLWNPLELDDAQVNLRIVANYARTHMFKIREEWTLEQIERALLSVSDRWRYVERLRTAEEQIAALRTAVQLAKRIYNRPPLFVVDYIGKISRGGRDVRTDLADSIEALREMAVDEECFGILLSQTSRGNNAVLTGKVDLDSAADAIGVSAETSELEHAAAVNIALNVFKVDDAQELDSHVLVSKARNTGLEGRVGFVFKKAGGQWHELAHLPPTPGEVAAEVTKAKKDKARIDQPTPKSTRSDLNFAKAAESNSERQRAIVIALQKAGMIGLGARELRKVRGCGNPKRTKATLDEMVTKGDVVEMGKGRWRIVPR